LNSPVTHPGHAYPDHHHGHDVGERLYLHRHSPIHSLPAQPKIVASLAFIIVVISTPITNWPAFLAYFVIILATTQVAQLPLKTVATRSVIEVPFIFFAILMPFFGKGNTIDLGPLTLYEDGLLAGTAIVAKGTLGILVAINLSATTTARQLLRGLELLKLPAMMVQIASFNPVLTTSLKIQGNNAFDASGAKVGELAKASNGQVFQAAAPPPPPSSTAGGKSAPKKTTKSSAAPVIVMNVLSNWH